MSSNDSGLPQAERRRHKRVPFVQTIRYRFPDMETFRELQLSDLSLGGMFIQTDDPEPIGTVVHFEFEVDGDRVLAGFGRVVRVNNSASDPELDPGMGLEFLQLDDASRRTLQTLLADR